MRSGAPRLASPSSTDYEHHRLWRNELGRPADPRATTDRRTTPSPHTAWPKGSIRPRAGHAATRQSAEGIRFVRSGSTPLTRICADPRACTYRPSHDERHAPSRAALKHSRGRSRSFALESTTRCREARPASGAGCTMKRSRSTPEVDHLGLARAQEPWPPLDLSIWRPLPTVAARRTTETRRGANPGDQPDVAYVAAVCQLRRAGSAAERTIRPV